MINVKFTHKIGEELNSVNFDTKQAAYISGRDWDYSHKFIKTIEISKIGAFDKCYINQSFWIYTNISKVLLTEIKNI
ncbi:hypothetical protein HYD58_00820 [Mycoplasmopsis bovis]|nr:hypothetical protein [Mycoplasmopsis bovis]QQH66012.1 hypothetical protein HYD58_00820 [Mycoplasmopsis bovis]